MIVQGQPDRTLLEKEKEARGDEGVVGKDGTETMRNLRQPPLKIRNSETMPLGDQASPTPRGTSTGEQEGMEVMEEKDQKRPPLEKKEGQ